MSAPTIRAAIVASLTPLMLAREYDATHPTGCPAIVPGVTHCLSCGFHKSTPRAVVCHRDRCLTPDWHGGAA